MDDWILLPKTEKDIAWEDFFKKHNIKFFYSRGSLYFGSREIVFRNKKGVFLANGNNTERTDNMDCVKIINLNGLDINNPEKTIKKLTQCV